MLTLYHHDPVTAAMTQHFIEGRLTALPERTVWIDLYCPTAEEEAEIESLLGIDVPTREEMQEIEVSSRLYVEDGATVMTMPVVSKATTGEPVSAAVTFIRVADYLVTVRYSEPAPFSMFVRRIIRQPAQAASGELAFLGLLEQIADRLADILEMATADIELLNREVFRSKGDAEGAPDFKKILRRIGRGEDLTTKATDSLLGLNRLLLFMGTQSGGKRGEKARVKTLTRDVKSLSDHATFLSDKIAFLLDATLGLINIEQNNIIKLFSVAAVTFLPPTLIASIYGMNFRHMPELDWPWGYPMAIGLMILSAVVPFWFFRHKKWL